MVSRTWLLVVPIVLAACAERPVDDELFPLGEGRRWTYRMSTTIDEAERTERETLVLSNRGADRIDGAVSWRRRSDSGVEYWLRSDPTGIYRFATRNPLDREPRIDEHRRFVLRKPYVVGTEWEASTIAYVLARKNEVPREVRYTHKEFPMTYRIEALDDKVATPAGEFQGCVRVAGKSMIRLYVDSVKTWRDVPLNTNEWYCPQVGLVRLERLEPSPSRFMVGGSVTLELLEWH